MYTHFSGKEIQMANKHVKRCPTFLVIRAMWIKTTTRARPTRMALTKETDNNKCWQRWEKLEPSYVACGNAKWCHCFENQFDSSSKS